MSGVFASLLFAVFAGGSLAWHLFGFLAVLLMIAFLSQIGSLSKVKIARTVAPGPYYARGTLDVSLTVTATWWPWLHLVLVERLRLNQGERDYRFLFTTAGHRVHNINYEVRDLQRGLLEFDDIVLTTSDVFGFFQRSVTIDGGVLSLRVWPRVVALSPGDLGRYVWQGEQLHSLQAREELAQLQGIREYVPGDRLSHVHWKTSAHTGDFKVKHFEPKISAEFMVVLDASYNFTASEWELAVSIAASMADRACRSRMALRVCAIDQPWDDSPPSSSLGSLARMMDFLSMLRHGEADPVNSEVPMRYGRHILVITTHENQGVWQGTADSVVIVGKGGVSSLNEWREGLGITRLRIRAPR